MCWLAPHRLNPVPQTIAQQNTATFNSFGSDTESVKPVKHHRRLFIVYYRNLSFGKLKQIFSSWGTTPTLISRLPLIPCIAMRCSPRCMASYWRSHTNLVLSRAKQRCVIRPHSWTSSSHRCRQYLFKWQYCFTTRTEDCKFHDIKSHYDVEYRVHPKSVKWIATQTYLTLESWVVRAYLTLDSVKQWWTPGVSLT